jgi:hypothetical protein
MGCTVWGSNPSRSEVFRIRPDRPWGPPSFLYCGYRVFSPGIKKKTVELHVCSPSGPSACYSPGLVQHFMPYLTQLLPQRCKALPLASSSLVQRPPVQSREQFLSYDLRLLLIAACKILCINNKRTRSHVQAQVTVRPVNLPVLRMGLFCRHCSFTIGLGTAVAQWLRFCATKRKVAGSIPDSVIRFFR